MLEANSSPPLSLAEALSNARTLLFVPGDRPERFAKAAAAEPDLVILDLEDAVPPENKDLARVDVAAWLSGGHRCAVRINDPATPWYESDVELVTQYECVVVVPKAECAKALNELSDSLRGGSRILALVETAQGILNSRDVATSRGVTRLAFGNYDLGAELGISPGDRMALQYMRSQVVLSSAALNLASPVDGVTAAVHHDEQLRNDIDHARRLGFGGKLCIHPNQVGVADTRFAPSLKETEWALRIVSAVSETKSRSAISVGGEMVDKPVLDRANRILGAPSRNKT